MNPPIVKLGEMSVVTFGMQSKKKRPGRSMASELEQQSNSGATNPDPAQKTLEREFERALAQETKDLAPEKRRALVAKSATLAIQFSGPIPPGFVLRDYEDVLAGAADRIISMAEKDQDHIHELQKRELELPHRYASLGMICGVFISAIAIAASAYVTVSGYPWVGTILFGSTLATVIWTFVRARLHDSSAEKPTLPPPTSKPKRRR